METNEKAVERMVDQLITDLSEEEMIDIYNDYIKNADDLYTCQCIYPNNEASLNYLFEDFTPAQVIQSINVDEYNRKHAYVTMLENGSLCSHDEFTELMYHASFDTLAEWILETHYWESNDNIKAPTICHRFNIRKAIDISIELDICADASIEDIARNICKQLPFMDTDKACKWVEVTDLEDTREFRLHEDEI